MKNPFLRSGTTVLLLASLGCATAYTGPGPDLSLRGDAAETEARAFKLEHSSWGDPWAFRRGPDETLTTVDSMIPSIERVSPRAADAVASAQAWRTTQTILLAPALIFIALAISADDGSSKASACAVGAIASSGVSIGAGIVANVKLTHAAEAFDEDLDRQLGRTSPPQASAKLPMATVGFAF